MFSPLKNASEGGEGVNQSLTALRNTPIRISRKLVEKLAANGKDGNAMSGQEDVIASLEKLIAANEFTNASTEQEGANHKVPIMAAPTGSHAFPVKDQSVQGCTESVSKAVHPADHESLNFTAVMPAGELSRFSDTPADGMLDDLFESTFKSSSVPPSDGAASSGCAAESTSHPAHLSSSNNGATSLAAMLKEKIAQRKEMGESQVKSSHVILPPLTGEEGAGVADLSLEISRLIGMLKPEESEDSIVRACHRLVSILRENPEQKAHFISQHGAMSFMDMLEMKNNRVLLAVLQVLNQLAKNNPGFQENACLVGLIPFIMNIANSECPKEMRMQAALFVGQLCQTRYTILVEVL
ncbi:hypothetical protein KP509_1Z325000 [Ceratopteris richardii]|nr:hypothetical protein KP509_1Z325000 [Ceratopteris richardii]